VPVPIAELNSSSATFAIVVGVPVAVLLLAVVWLAPQWPAAVRAGSSLVLVALIGLGVWTVFQSAGPDAEASPPLTAFMPRGAAPPAPQPAPGPPAPAASPCRPSGTQVQVTARNLAFDRECLAAPADTAFTIAFNNDDAGQPHNVSIISDGEPLFTGEIITGPRTVTYRVNALQLGSFQFRCDVHPQMQGTFVVQ
jgi:plastocyanin